jgi:hypothetical protein
MKSGSFLRSALSRALTRAGDGVRGSDRSSDKGVNGLANEIGVVSDWRRLARGYIEVEGADMLIV